MLIADGLAVDYEADLRVVAQRMEEAVGVRGHAASAVDDRLAEARAGVERGDLRKLRAVHVHVCGGMHFEEVCAGRFDCDAGVGAGDGERRLEWDGDSGADDDVFREGVEARSGDFDVVRVLREVGEAKRAVCGGNCGARIRGDGVANGYLGVGYRCAAGIGNRAFDGTGVAERLSRTVEPRQQHGENDSASPHIVQYGRRVRGV